MAELTVRTRDLFPTPDQDGPDQDGIVYDPACVEAMVAAVGETLTIPVKLTMKPAGDPSCGIVTMGLTVDTGSLQDLPDQDCGLRAESIAAFDRWRLEFGPMLPTARSASITRPTQEDTDERQ